MLLKGKMEIGFDMQVQMEFHGDSGMGIASDPKREMKAAREGVSRMARDVGLARAEGGSAQGVEGCAIACGPATSNLKHWDKFLPRGYECWAAGSGFSISWIEARKQAGWAQAWWCFCVELVMAFSFSLEAFLGYQM
ncbi:hypothetical protein Acr_00g0065840 [Actinidia rufa]|uniref:Uncharacterized protein n=1 Tax=Actinidia rufa TaxID=165716 RepID=A0A7J0DPX2_9ERIC|nr:hypothetical protein Acr_00g0065840 [Actinidia rufa]